jgi:hypothetical protein
MHVTLEGVAREKVIAMNPGIQFGQVTNGKYQSPVKGNWKGGAPHRRVGEVLGVRTSVPLRSLKHISTTNTSNNVKHCTLYNLTDPPWSPVLLECLNKNTEALAQSQNRPT